MPRALPQLALLLAAASAAAGAAAAAWAELAAAAGRPTARHEASFVMAGNGKAYLVGGRGARPVDVFDVRTGVWRSAGVPPAGELHHFQAVAVGDGLFVPAAWTGAYPHELNVPEFWVYNVSTSEWAATRTPMPAARRRGGGAVVHHAGKLYVSHGNRGGHGEHATSLAWLDVYDIARDEWSVGPDAPHARDHTGGAVVGGRLCVAGGRDGGSAAFFAKTVVPTDCYDFASGKWAVEEDIPTPRAGSAVGAACDGRMIVAGGEGPGKAFDDVEWFDGKAWAKGDRLARARHGSGLAVGHCGCGFVYFASGGASQGGAKELETVERFTPAGTAAGCKANATTVMRPAVKGTEDEEEEEER
jgi:hypothetical protein